MTTYHVATTGNNLNSGTTQASAWRTINYGTTTMGNGDALIVHSGTYNEIVNIAGTNKTISTTEGAIIDGSGKGSGYQGLVNITGTNIIFDGFEIKNGTSGSHIRGISAGGTSASWHTGMITIRNCTIHNIQAEAFVFNYQDGVLIKDCTWYDCTLNNYNYAYDSAYGWHDGTGTLTPVRNAEVTGCLAYNNWGECIAFDKGTASQPTANINIHHNIVANSISNMIYSGHAQQVKIHHNLCYISDNNPTGNGGNAIGVVDEHYATSYNDAEDVDVYDNLIIGCNKGFDLDLGSGQGPLTNVHIYHNMIINCGTGLYLYNYNPGTDWVTCEFKNNLVYGGTMIGTSGGTTGWTFDYNSWESTPAAGSGGNDQIGNQNLSSPDTAVYGLNVTTANYKLTALSTGPIDNGATGLTLYDGDTMDLDFWGLERGASDIDIGGNEYDGAVPDPLPDPDPEPIGLTIAQDAGRKELHGDHINTEIVDTEDRGRWFDGNSAYVDLATLGGEWSPDAGTISLLWKAAAGTHTDAQTRHIFEAYAWNSTTSKNSYWLIKQNGDETITFTVVIEDVEITPITVANTSYSAQVLTMTWDSGGDVSAYVDGSGVGTPDAWPETYLVSEPEFVHIGKGGQAYHMKGVAADFVMLRDLELTAGQVTTLAGWQTAETVSVANLDGISSDWSWFGLYDLEEIEPPDPTEPSCVLTSDVTSGEVPLTVAFDWSGSVADTSDPVSYYLFYFDTFKPPVNVGTDTDYEYIYTQPGGLGTVRAICHMFLESGQNLFSNYIDIYPYETNTLPTYPQQDDVTAIVDRIALLKLASEEFLAEVTA